MAGWISREGSPRDPRRPDLKKLLALFAVLAMVIAACGGGDDAGDTTVAGGDTGDTTADGDTGSDGEQIEMWVWASRDWYAVPDNFEAFMEENPNITVTQDVQGNDDILQQLQRMKDAGQPMPDVINDDTFLMESYIAAGIARPFDDLMAQWEEEDPEEFANILPIAW
jgi:ABC-type glycerol-3-phosphate transport system substrate-binding protein